MQANGTFGGYGRHRMLINQSLLVVVFEDNSKIVKTDHPALDRHTVRQVYGYTHLFFAYLVKYEILQIILCHGAVS